jgi:hypothetical protein
MNKTKHINPKLNIINNQKIDNYDESLHIQNSDISSLNFNNMAINFDQKYDTQYNNLSYVDKNLSATNPTEFKLSSFSLANDGTYGQFTTTNDSLPINYKNIIYEGMDIALSSPSDVIISDSDKLSESELDSIPGFESDNNTNFNINNMPYIPNRKNWSPTSTMQQMVNKNGDQVNSDIFQVFIAEMIRDKCWSRKDINEFINNVKIMKDFMNNTKNSEDRIAMLLDPKYYNTIHDMLDKLDTINVMCTLRAGDKCNMINNPQHKNIMKKQVQVIGKLVDIYAPIFARIILLTDRLTTDLSSEDACNLDPIYLNTVKTIKSRVIGSLYMNRISNKTPKEQRDILRQMSNSNNIVNNSNIQVEHYGNSNNVNWSFGICFILIFVIMIVLFFYQ